MPPISSQHRKTCPLKQRQSLEVLNCEAGEAHRTSSQNKLYYRHTWQIQATLQAQKISLTAPNNINTKPVSPINDRTQDNGNQTPIQRLMARPDTLPEYMYTASAPTNPPRLPPQTPASSLHLHTTRYPFGRQHLYTSHHLSRAHLPQHERYAESSHVAAQSRQSEECRAG